MYVYLCEGNPEVITVQDFMLDRRLVYFAACGLARLEQARTDGAPPLGRPEGKQNSSFFAAASFETSSTRDAQNSVSSFGLSVSGPYASSPQ